MIPKTYRDAHERVDAALSDLESLLYGVWALMNESPSINHGHPDARAFMAILRAGEEAAKRGLAGQNQAWDAIREIYHPEGTA